MPRLKEPVSHCCRDRKRMELESLVKRVIHCRLETDPNFFDYFVEGCQFNPIDTFNVFSEERTDVKICQSKR